jgi:hypothetical protein
VKKRVDLTITIDLPSDHNADRLSIGADGSIQLFDKSGKAILPEKIERAAHFERPKGPKYQSLATAQAQTTTIGGLEDLAQFDSLIAIDTNRQEIDGVTVFAAFFIVCKLIPESGGFRVKSLDGQGHLYEFHNVPEGFSSEMLAILKVAHDTKRGRGVHRQSRIAFLNDCDMGRHDAFSQRTEPIYGSQYLPEGFVLRYASTDTGQELSNKLVRFCDAQSKRHLARLKSGATPFRTAGLARLDEDQSVCFRYFDFPGLSIVNPAITGAALTPESKCTVIFSGD